jgi:putative ABC transport system permease protein
VVAESISRSRFLTALLGAFAAFALLLAAIGVYGVMAYSVSQRTQEIGMRMALGARAANVVRMVMGQGIAVVAIGLFTGFAASLALTRLMEKLLFNVQPLDPVAFAAAPLILAAAALSALYLPARRATRIDPVRALRYE